MTQPLYPPTPQEWAGVERCRKSLSTGIQTPDCQPLASNYTDMKHPLIMNKVTQLDI